MSEEQSVYIRPTVPLDGKVMIVAGRNFAAILRQIDSQDLRRTERGWIIEDPHKYKHIPQVRSAIEEMECQLRMF